eukprot:gene4458-6304_t
MSKLQISPDHATDFDSLAKDVLTVKNKKSDGDNSYEEDDDDDDDDELDDAKAKESSNENKEDEKKYPPFMFFDFRGGEDAWPRCVELVDPIKANELLSKATAAANAASTKSGAAASAGGDVTSNTKGAKEGTENAESAMWGKENPENENEHFSPPSDAEYLEMNDESYALIIKQGYRLRFNLKELLEGGDEKKEEREKKQLQMKNRTKRFKNEYGGRMGMSMGMEDGNMENFDVFEDNGMMNGSKFKMKKQYINEYTISIDMKLVSPPPMEGLSLFQTALVHVKENKRNGEVTQTSSDGECVMNYSGGVGILDNYGTAKLKSDSWKRVVIAVKCVEKGAKGEYRSWIGVNPGCSVKDEMFASDDRFSINPSDFFLFSSNNPSMMPGNIAIKTVRVELAFLSDEQVKADRARDKVLSTYEEQRKEEVRQQRQYFSLHSLFAKPRPMWYAPAFVETFGDSFIENTALEGSSQLAWSYQVLNFALQKMILRESSNNIPWQRDHIIRKDRTPLILSREYDLDYEARKSLTSVLKIMDRSSILFKILLKMMKNPSDQKVLTFLRKFKVELANIDVMDSLLVPIIIEGQEMLLLIEHTANERYFDVSMIQTNPKGGLLFHAVNVSTSSNLKLNPCIKYRTVMVLQGVLKKNIMDDVFWLAVFNMTIRAHKGDTMKFYNILIPFLTGKPLEVSLVEAETTEVEGLCGPWRLPQRSSGSVKCIFEALNYLLRKRGLTELQSEQVYLCLCMELVSMMKHDLKFMTPDYNGVRVCEMAIKELSRLAVAVIDHANNNEGDGNPKINGTLVLSETLSLAQSAKSALSFCQHEDSDALQTLDLTATNHDANGNKLNLVDRANDDDLTQFRNLLSWDVSISDPNPGQVVTLQKYMPVDLLQIPRKTTTRADAIRAIRMCDRLCTLIDNQVHCIKNEMFLMVSVIEHVFTQVVPVPKPRGMDLSNADLIRSERSLRRAQEKEKKKKQQADEKAKRLADLKSKLPSKSIKSSTPGGGKLKSSMEADPTIKCFGEELQPEFSSGKQKEEKLTKQKCIWDQPIKYELQVELLLSLQRIQDQFAAATMSIHQSRPFDAVCIIVSGCISAIADAIMRQLASDEPSEACSHLSGRTVLGKQLGNPGFGIDTGSFATQSETLEIYTPELCLARTAVLDYFKSPQQRRLEKIFSWEDDFFLRPGKNLIRYLRMISHETALSIAAPYKLLIDSNPIASELMSSYPELKCYRDIICWWKFFLNTDRKAFPNYNKNSEKSSEISSIGRMEAKLDFAWDDRNHCYKVTALGIDIHCRPDPKQKNPLTGKVIPPHELPTHRYASTATPSFYLPLPQIKTEDDVIYRPNLPSFEDKYGQVLNQRDSELLISYLTVPYMRIPLVLTFFASDDRIHKLQSGELRSILDSVLFEPSKYLSLDMTDVEPLMVPTPQKDLMATSYGLLLNELCCSPAVIVHDVLALLRGGLACDTGTVVDRETNGFNISSTIILYTSRLGARLDNYISFLVDHATGMHDCIDYPLRELEISNESLEILQKGRTELRKLLTEQYAPLFDDYLNKLQQQVVKHPKDEKIIDRNSRLACDIHAHKILFYRNFLIGDLALPVAKTLISSFVYLTTRHTWNKTASNGFNRLSLPETEIYEVLQVSRRRLVTWAGSCSQGMLDELMESALKISSSLTGSFNDVSSSNSIVTDVSNRWCRITGARSIGRWAVGSSRTLTNVVLATESDKNVIPSLKRSHSFDERVEEVADDGLLGVEIDVQLGQMTLRSRHLSALISDVANHPDMRLIFGEATIQGSMLDRSEHRTRYRLVGLDHEIDYWSTPHHDCSILGEEWDREYDPGDLGENEGWIPGIFEPIRKNFYSGEQPPPMQFMMSTLPTPANAEVVTLIGLHQKLGGPFKLVYLFRRLRCVHIYECISHGREWWFTLHLTTDNRFCHHYLQPSSDNRRSQYPDWWIRAGGHPYPAGLQAYLCNNIEDQTKNGYRSIVITRDAQHYLNLSGGRETFIPSRLLFGLIPDALLESYTFWQDESVAPLGAGVIDESGELDLISFVIASKGYKKIRGYPKEESVEFILEVEFSFTGQWKDAAADKNDEENSKENENEQKQAVINDPSIVQVTGFPGRTVTVTKRTKSAVLREFQQLKRIALEVEQMNELLRPLRKKKSHSEKETSEKQKKEVAKVAFKMDEEVECNYEGKEEYWPCIIHRVNDDETYDLEYLGDYKWLGIQRNVEVELIQKRGAKSEAAKSGEGIYHWDGMSESEDEDWKDEDSDAEDKSDLDSDSDEAARKKQRITFLQFSQIPLLLRVSHFHESICINILKQLHKRGERFENMYQLAFSMKEIFRKENNKISNDANEDYHAEDMQLLNLLYSPRKSRLHSLMKVLARIESMSHICAWTKVSQTYTNKNSNSMMWSSDIEFSCASIDLIELPRLKLNFSAKVDHNGVLRLYSVDHVDLYVANESIGPSTIKMLSGIPHALVLTNVRGETQILVPVIPVLRPVIQNEPFSSFIVLDRLKAAQSERFFLYPIHISSSFLLTRGLNSALYLMVLKLLHREYATVFRLADSIAADTEFNSEGKVIFESLKRANDDFHPDAHACRLKISLVVIDSGMKLPWDLTSNCAKYIIKLDCVSSCCQLTLAEELQLLESNSVATSLTSVSYNEELHDSYMLSVCFNRMNYLSAMLNSQSKELSQEIPCSVPNRLISNNWPYYQDNTLFGEKYAQMLSISSADEGEHQWGVEVLGEHGDVEDAPADGWLVLAVFHTLWSKESVSFLTKLGDLLTIYQDDVNFLSVRADGFGIQPVAKAMKIETFPTAILFRGGLEIERMNGHTKLLERIVQAFTKYITSADKIARAKHRHRMQLQRSLALTKSIDASEENESNQIDWSFDSEMVGHNVKLDEIGMTARIEESSYNQQTTWEIVARGSKAWKAVAPDFNARLERAYRKGTLYDPELPGSGRNYTKVMSEDPAGYSLYCCDKMNISNYIVSGFVAVESSSGRNLDARRMGERLSVPNEDSFLSDEQRASDIVLKEQQQRYKLMRKKMKQERVGNDLVAIRGGFGFLENTGIHEWVLRWNHDPPRKGFGDAIGVCSDAMERIGWESKFPCLGGFEDGGVSLGLYANGNLYHNGKSLFDKNSAQYSEEFKVDNNGGNKDDLSNADNEAKLMKKNSNEEPQDSFLLFRRGSLAKCVLDTSNGGSISFYIDEEKIEGASMSGLYQLLGAQEIFPVVCMCPLDEVESAEMLYAEENETKNLPPPKFPSVTLLSYEEVKLLGEANNKVIAVIEPVEENKEPISDEISKNVSPDAEVSNEEKDTGNVDVTKPKSEKSVSKEEIVPIERVRWMYESEGWKVYSVEQSEYIEIASRNLDSHCVVRMETIVHTINLDKRKYTRSDSDGEFKLRRHVVSEGIPGLWEVLAVTYESPSNMFNGTTALGVLEKVWSSNETMNGELCGLGFIFLYTLLTGEKRFKIAETMGMGMGMGMMFGKGKFGGGRGRGNNFTSGNDSLRFALLLSQLYLDKQVKSLPASLINIIARNPQLSLRLPKFKDNRQKAKSKVYYGWTDDVESVSPVSDLFEKVVPFLTSLKRKGALHFPPNPPFPEMLPPSTTITISTKLFSNSLTTGIPEISDYSCESRKLSPVSSTEISSLIKSIHYRLGSDEFKTFPPLHIEDTAHFDKLVKSDLTKLFIVDFHASWCGPCKTIEPAFRFMSMSTPVAQFFKVDVDACDDLAKRFKVDSMPRILFMRGGITADFVLETISGGGPQFVQDFIVRLMKCLTEEEKRIFERFNSDTPAGDNASELLANLAADDNQINKLASIPLKECFDFVSSSSREDLGLEPINPVMSFDISNLQASKTTCAKRILNRFSDDIQEYAKQTNSSRIIKLTHLPEQLILSFFSQEKSENQATLDTRSKFEHSLVKVEELSSVLYKIRDQDAQMLQESIPMLLQAANFISPFQGIDQMKEGAPTISDEDLRSKARFLLNRISDQNSMVWVEFLFGILVSSCGEIDLLKLNPYLDSSTIKVIMNLTGICMLRANRLGHINRCIGSVISLMQLLKETLNTPPSTLAERKTTLTPKLLQLNEEIAKTITMKRHYMVEVFENDASHLYDPRYLVFEFIWNIQLRKKQIEIIDEFRTCLASGTSRVKQMIMGAGKTSVVAPLLALIVADGKSLVLSVVPKALVEMSRTRMRETFASILVKRIYTLEFDRSTVVKPSMYRSLSNAVRNRGVVVATPTALKSVMLSYIEALNNLAESRKMGLYAKVEELKAIVLELSKILQLFEDGIMLLDEVDLILHPLKSELNFPIGDKFDLDCSTEGERWGLPIHLMDAFFFTTTGKVTTFEQEGSTLELLKQISGVINEGIAMRHLQKLPHITLLNTDFYHEKIKPLMAEWTFFWLQRQHLYGINRDEVVRYILEGAAAKSDASNACAALTAALNKLNSSNMKSQLEVRCLKDSLTLNSLLEEKMNSIHSTSNHLESISLEESNTIDKLKNEINVKTKQIAVLESPRDDSMDNSVIVWCSQAFAGAAESNTTGSGLISVSSICNTLENSGYSIRKCSDADEAIARAKDLKGEGMLRCVVIGGDESGNSCGSSCTKTHEGKKCLKCGETFRRHNGHMCGVGGRGTFPLDKIAGASEAEIVLKIMSALVGPQPAAAKLTSLKSDEINSVLPTTRCLYYSAGKSLGASTHVKLWEMNATIIEEPKVLIKWLTNLSEWQIEEIEKSDTSHPLLIRQMSDRSLLIDCKRDLQLLEEKKAALIEEYEAKRKEMQLNNERCYTSLLEIVESRLVFLSTIAKEIRDMLGSEFTKDESPTISQSGHFGVRNSALSIAWFEMNKERLVIKSAAEARKLASGSNSRPSTGDSDKSDLTKHLENIHGEMDYLKKFHLGAKVIACVTSSVHKKLLNLCFNWLSTFLPHCLAKINRVSFGLLSKEDCESALKLDPHVPRSRLKLAVPFIGKDVPSKSSEFAHPDVIIGLTVLAYRYSGLRQGDFTDIIDSLTAQYSHEIGPSRERESSRRHESWVYISGGVIRGLKTNYDGLPWKPYALATTEAVSLSTNGTGATEVVQLKFLQKSNREQMNKLFSLIRFEPVVIHYYLQSTIFPLYMRSQKMKLSASGQSVGGDMLVGRRIGFSGTPSDLLPEELGKCGYEKGDDGMMLTTCLDRAITSYEIIMNEWSVDYLLSKIANPDKSDDGSQIRYHALIDTGALITGYSNEEVARKLLEMGLTWCEGIVFLDDDDKQQVLVRATSRVVSADQCGVSLDKRFAFYDQIHTTGMDIKHVVNAVAVITLGKDMVFRDYVQDAYRMRGIGIGQRIHIFIIPEVKELMHRELRGALISASNGKDSNHVLEDVVAWLFLNSLRSEQTQWTMLQVQNITNLYRKNAFKSVHRSTNFFLTETENPIKFTQNDDTDSSLNDFISSLDEKEAIRVFDESIDFSLESSVPDSVPFAIKLKELISTNLKFLRKEQLPTSDRILNEVNEVALVEKDSSADRLDTEQEREQEQEQEREVEARRDQQIEVEKFVDREYSRQEETQRPWSFRTLSSPLPSFESYDSSQLSQQQQLYPFYPLREFKMRHHKSLSFPKQLMLSTNYFNPNWLGIRRLKNVVMILEFAPSTLHGDLRVGVDDDSQEEMDEIQEMALKKAHQLFGFHASMEGNVGYQSMEDLG